MRKFKFTIIILIVIAVTFLHINVTVINPEGVEAYASADKSGYTVSGKILPFYKSYKGYEYKIENGAAKIQIKTVFGLFGDKSFNIHIGNCRYIYIIDSENMTEIEIK